MKPERLEWRDNLRVENMRGDDPLLIAKIKYYWSPLKVAFFVWTAAWEVILAIDNMK
ncbi:unnamed protein product [Ilex paraguariensis]|uniref:Reverse transcriptase zinc-binding domain-containing protein n=1 Tax=Ilex paraguariensis TaxID=185542 RepID=A0ABC8UF93_9AQUA